MNIEVWSALYCSVMGKMNKLYIYSETVQTKEFYNQVILNAF